MQLSLFEPKLPKVQHKYPWEPFFDWMPQVGDVAQMGTVILPSQGYCYGDTIRILDINGEDVRCVVENQCDPNWWKNGTVYLCTMNDLWPNVYNFKQS